MADEPRFRAGDRVRYIPNGQEVVIDYVVVEPTQTSYHFRITDGVNQTRMAALDHQLEPLPGLVRAPATVEGPAVSTPEGMIAEGGPVSGDEDSEPEPIPAEEVEATEPTDGIIERGAEAPQGTEKFLGQPIEGGAVETADARREGAETTEGQHA